MTEQARIRRGAALTFLRASDESNPVQRILIFGNSGSGKSTLAKAYKDKYGLAHLDLDSVAWQPSSPPTRRPIDESEAEIRRFLDTNRRWVIEGCYSDLLALVANDANEAIFLNPGVDQCIANCRRRPWEPHKYASPQAQDDNLPMLLDWVRQYPERVDGFSLRSHRALFASFQGEKIEHTTNVAMP